MIATEITVDASGQIQVEIQPRDVSPPSNFDAEFKSWTTRHSWYKHIPLGEMFSVFPSLRNHHWRWKSPPGRGHEVEWLIEYSQGIVSSISDPDVRRLVLENQVEANALIYGDNHGFDITCGGRRGSTEQWVAYARTRGHVALADEVERQKRDNKYINVYRGVIPDLLKAAKANELMRTRQALREAADRIWSGLTRLGYDGRRRLEDWEKTRTDFERGEMHASFGEWLDSHNPALAKIERAAALRNKVDRLHRALKWKEMHQRKEYELAQVAALKNKVDILNQNLKRVNEEHQRKEDELAQVAALKRAMVLFRQNLDEQQKENELRRLELADALRKKKRAELEKQLHTADDKTFPQPIFSTNLVPKSMVYDNSVAIAHFEQFINRQEQVDKRAFMLQMLEAIKRLEQKRGV